MKNFFLAVCSAIITSFVMKVIDRIKNPPLHDNEELHKEVLRKKRAYEEERRLRNNVGVLHASTPRSADAWLSNIGTVGEMAKLYKENIPAPKEPCDHAALRPVMDMATASNFEPAIGRCAR